MRCHICGEWIANEDQKTEADGVVCHGSCLSEAIASAKLEHDKARETKQ